METLIPDLLKFFGGAGTSIAIMWYWLKDKDKTIDWLKEGVGKQMVKNDKLTSVLIADRKDLLEGWDNLTNAIQTSQPLLVKENDDDKL